MNTLAGEFVYDDQVQIVRNPSIRSLKNAPRMFTQSVWQFLSAGAERPVGLYYRPVFNTVLILNYRLFGLRAFGWHLISLLLHLAATFLVFRMASSWNLRRDVAGAAALLFGLHPVHSEAVAWISALPDPLVTLSLLGAALLYERYYHGPGGSTAVMAGSISLALVAMFTKEVAVMFPLWLIAREVLDRADDERLKEAIWRALMRTAAFFAAAAFSLAVRYHVLGFLSSVEPHAVAIPDSQVVLTLPMVLIHYARLLVVPYPLAVTYDLGYVTTPQDPRFWAAGVAVVCLFAAIGFVAWRSAVLARAFLWMLLFLLPVLSLKSFNQEESLVHDRYLYLPSVGFAILTALLLERLSFYVGRRRRSFFALGTLVVALAYLILTVAQNRTWRNDLSMTQQALRLAPQKPFLHNYLGAYYFLRGDLPEAEQAYLRAIQYQSSYADGYSNLGDVYHVQGRLADAERDYRKAIALGARYPNTFSNLGVVLIGQEKFAEAERFLRHAVALQPDFVKGHYNLGWVYQAQGKNRMARRAYLRVLELDPSYTDARTNLNILPADE